MVMTSKFTDAVQCGIVCVVVAAIVNAAPSSKLPSGFIRCSKTDPNLGECLRDGLQKAIPHLAEGIPSLGIVKIDPLRILSLKINQGKGPVNINMSFTNIDIINLKYVQAKKVVYDVKNYHLHFETFVPKSIIMEGDYEINGQVLVLPVVGKGKCKFTLDVSKYSGDVQLKPVVKKGTTYYEIANVKWTFVPTLLHIRMDNLFNGNKELSDNMNLFLNENWRELLQELQPAFEEVLGVAFGEIGKQFLDRVPENEIFLS
ncbi:Haemolymph juvenile hormone binding [Cinara cedri]|uniref:Haemolymph juvenile hormone binding n=1 Tax=Cinara cedri TaxID=506608 RepID=A0A5E4NET7_9HEMI|nr:Haemolymph juvenile hormone binding [Cinara cedri]